VGGDAQTRCPPSQPAGETTLLCSPPKDLPKTRKGTQTPRFPPPSPPLGHPTRSTQAPQLPSRLPPPGFAAFSAGPRSSEEGAGARSPDLLRLVLFQQDFLVPAIPGGATLGWVGSQRALPRAGLGAWVWPHQGLLAAAPRGQAPAGGRCSRGGGEPAPSSPAGEVKPLAGDGVAREGVLGTTRFSSNCSFPIASSKRCKKSCKSGGWDTIRGTPSNFMNPPAAD